ncbi:ABC transporter substrate binding protein [Pelagibius sp. 7325]|uniref:sensor histidine kinase n=1 Tax=Pelagibius sp. 7325 TaxID=3131994 RepID=UPI0030EEB94A
MAYLLCRRLLGLLILCYCGASGAAAQDRPQILVLAAGDSMLPATRIMSDEILHGLQTGLRSEVDIFVEFLDALRFPGADYESMMGELLQKKHGSKQFDLIYALGPPAYDFVAARRETPYLSAPVVFLAMREGTIQSLPPMPNATGIVSRFDLLETVKLAKLLQPGLQNLFVVTGASSFDRSWEEVARRELPAAADGLNVSFLAALPLRELMARLDSIPKGSALLYLTMFEEPDGTAHMAPDIAASLAQAAPVYSVYSTYLDRGIVGGHMDTFEGVGQAGADLGLRILAGEEADSIPPEPVGQQAYVVNWPALQRWSLDPGLLPAETIFRNQHPSVWDEYRDQILIFITLLVLQTLLIIALMTQGRRRRLAETRLMESEDRMRLAASSANLGLWHWDSDSNKVWMTDHCRRMLGLPVYAELTIESLLAAVQRDDRYLLRRQIEQSARWEKPFDTECRIILADGSIRWLSVKGQSTRKPSTPTEQITGVVIDISERKAEQIEAEQQRSQLTHLTRVAILGELSGAMAHELNQPLAAILSNAQAAQRLLERDPLNLEETRAIMADIVADDLRAGEVIQRLRNLLKRGKIKPERLDVSELTGEALELARSELVTHQVSLATELEPDLPAVLGDRIQLQQVLLNLIVNACEAMRETPPAQRVLSVRSCEGKNREIEIIVTDHGKGIAPEIVDQLFEPFATTKKEGLGLGLSVSRAIVLAHNGHLRARNGKSGGAIFSVVLPSEG